MTWTVALEDELRGLIAQGLSAGSIAGRLNGFTRSAIIGKAHRLGLKLNGGHNGGWGPNTARKPREKKRALKKPNYQYDALPKPGNLLPAERAARGAIVAAKIAQQAATELADLPPEDASAAVEFMQLGPGMCRFPIGDSRSLKTVRFCGKTPKPDRPYCEHHCERAYRPYREDGR